MRIHGSHNAANAMAALARAEALDLPMAPPSSAGVVRGASPLAVVRDVAGVAYVNDSKWHHVGATLAAVTGMSGRWVLIAVRRQGPGFRRAAHCVHGKVRHAG